MTDIPDDPIRDALDEIVEETRRTLKSRLAVLRRMESRAGNPLPERIHDLLLIGCSKGELLQFERWVGSMQGEADGT